MSVWTLFESVVARAADRVALEVQGPHSLDTWTYRQLHEAAAGYAGRLHAHGIGAGDRCALLADVDARWCAAYLGILASGGVVVPLDTNASTTQVATIVHDAKPRAVFVGARFEPLVREAVAADQAILVEPLSTADAGSGSRPVLPQVTKADAAVLLYTSGATADPKGVVLSHANLLAVRDAARAVIDVTERDRVLGLLPPFHALAQVTTLLLPFTGGARVVLLEAVTSAELVRALAERQITVLACAPQVCSLIHERLMRESAWPGAIGRAVWRALLSSALRLRRLGINTGPLLFRRVHRLAGGRLRLFVTGGSKSDPAIDRDLYALGFTILRAYGLTETAGVVTVTRPDDAPLDTVGRPLPGQEVRILPSEDEGRDGEIAVRGPVVMQGYVNRPEAARAALRDGWLLTGDLGHIDRQGRLIITGHKNDVIVLAPGKNIYAEKIEAQYGRSPFVKEICVFGLADSEPGPARLHAVVVPDMELMRRRRIANAGDLLRFELEGQSVHLPPHERVQGFDVWFEPLPRTPAGKLKRYEIERRASRMQRERTRFGQPVLLEQQWAHDRHALRAAQIIARHARSGVVGPDANLELDLALDSMERVELLAELEQRFGVRVDETGAHMILTVSQLIDAVRPAGGEAAARDLEAAWATMLRNLPASDDPLLRPLLRRWQIAPALFFLLLRTLRLLAPRVECTGLEHLPPSGPYIISPNHQSYLDPLFVCSMLPYRVVRRLFFVGATEYFETSLTAWLARQVSLVPVDPDANLVPAMQAGAFGLAQGRILVLFPEGERSIDGTVKRFKKGAAVLARHLQVPIVPVAVHGAFELWPRNRPVNWRRALPWSRHVVQLAFGTPMQIAADVSHAEATAALREHVRDLWEALDRSAQHARRQPRAGAVAGKENA